jgi:hypothetical protein
VISLISAVIAAMARQDSKKSAREVEKARKVSQADLLAEHFHNINYLIHDATLSSYPRPDNFNNIDLGIKSAKIIISLIGDQILKNHLEELVDLHGKFHDKVTEARSLPTESAVIANTETFESLHNKIVAIKNQIDICKPSYLEIS